jgi:hypothetical protein
MKKRYKCECCGNYTLPEESSGTDYICSVCYWQDDYVQLHDPDYSGGANRVSLNQARKNFIAFGSSEEWVLQFVRKPLAEELPENNV